MDFLLSIVSNIFMYTNLDGIDMFKFQIMTSGIISGDQAAVKRIFSLISRPLSDFKDLYYPSFAEWVSCKVFKSIISSFFKKKKLL